ncbi:ester cyclase [Gloeobacter morelensis MG652769]|uniref:Ester cyclase n=2 Tax=Gloeobacter TaxID=33071 RepID=A0ABY3PRD9_9CYAN|nr:ester cyclase [Gloeobacter morelensis MG652769]
MFPPGREPVGGQARTFNACHWEAPMSAEANKALVRKFYEEVFNRRNLALADELVTPDGINHATPPGVPSVGPSGIRFVVSMLTEGFPDHHHAIEDLFAEGDKVAMRCTFSGTHTGGILGLPPTGRAFRQQQMHILRIEGGKLAEHWAVRDDLALMQQLGAIANPNGPQPTGKSPQPG